MKQLKSKSNIPISKFLISCRIYENILYVVRDIKRADVTDTYLVPYVPDSLMQSAFAITHDDVTAGHKGPDRTLKQFCLNFYNKNERTLITEMCKKCEYCIKAKAIAKPVPLSLYPNPIKPFHSVASDIIGPLRITEAGNQYILTVRDYTTRYTILFPLKHKDTDSIINSLRQVIANFGSSFNLVTDNAQEFISNKLTDFLKYYNTRKIEISPYHPSSGGLAERINREINKILRIYTNSLAINDWDIFLPVVQLSINSTFNASIKETPFFALFGHDSATTALAEPKLNYSQDDLHLRMQRIYKIREYCRNSLLQSQTAYTNYANQGRSPKMISIGQRVYAKIDKHQNTPRQKLDLPISGPFQVTNTKGKAYELAHLNTDKKYIVHPDYIITNNIQHKSVTEEKTIKQSQKKPGNNS